MLLYAGKCQVLNYKCKITAFTVSELLRKNHKEGGVDLKFSLTQIRVNVKYLLLDCITIFFINFSSIAVFP